MRLECTAVIGGPNTTLNYLDILWSHVSNAPGPVYWHSTPAMAEITDKLQYNNLWSSAQPGQCHTCHDG